MFGSFEAGLAELPQIARYLGGRMRDGLGDYYRQMTALIRILEKNAAGNLVARFSDGGRDDHYADAETYCLQAMRMPGGARVYTL